MTLLQVAELFAKTLRYYIAQSRKEGDEEGARMKELTLAMVEQAIVQARA